jgi:lysozyme
MAGVFVQGIDVSHHNGTIDFAKVAASGVKFVLMKATEATSFVDPKFGTNWANASAVGLKRGAYHFFRPGISGINQADNLITQLKKHGFAKGDIIPTVDCEDYDGSGKPAYQTQLQAFIDRVASAFDVGCMIYTYRGFWKKIGNPTSFAKYPLWVVDLSSVNDPRLPAGWTDYAVWQYTFDGKVPGIVGDVDRDRFNGDLAALSSICK